MQIYKKKSDEQNRFTYSATPPFSMRKSQQIADFNRKNRTVIVIKK